MEISFVWADVRLFVDLRLTSRGGERRGGGGGRKRLKRRESIRGWKKGDELKGRSGNLFRSTLYYSPSRASVSKIPMKPREERFNRDYPRLTINDN